MNIFVLDENPIKAAQMHNDVHVRKMIVESAQMLSTNYRLLNGTQETRLSKSGKTKQKYWKLDDMDELVYKAVHVNHPCTVWARESQANWSWLVCLFFQLCREYEYRFNKEHLTWTKLGHLFKTHPDWLPSKPFKGFAICMEQYPHCKVPGDAVQSYRNYYIDQKLSFTTYTKREVPEWLKSHMPPTST